MQNATENFTDDVIASSTNIQSKEILSSSALVPSSKWFNLSTVLNESTDGKNIIKHYENEGMILPKHRKLLNKLILNKTFSIKNQLTIAEREDIAQQISLVFHKEKSVYILSLRT